MRSLGVDDADTCLGLRGLRTLGVRPDRHRHQALELARRPREQGGVRGAVYPALPGDPGHELWRRDPSAARACSGPSGPGSGARRGGDAGTAAAVRIRPPPRRLREPDRAGRPGRPAGPGLRGGPPPEAGPRRNPADPPFRGEAGGALTNHAEECILILVTACILRSPP
ncbi:PLP-dependent transferase [Streptomyces sp. HK10]|uniref:PLP-dependent transferase n=1 Tax=Streptomyces sp. HK10 TaxID=3373255 RepID=UPI003748D3D5